MANMELNPNRTDLPEADSRLTLPPPYKLDKSGILSFRSLMNADTLKEMPFAMLATFME
jgi:hypothetical protein